MNLPIRILVVDDHPLLREGLLALLQSSPDMELVAEAGDGVQAVSAYFEHRPDVVLMDLQMPRMDGIEAIARIRATSPEARIIVLTTYSGDAKAVKALHAGASAYLLKDMLRHELLSTIRLVHSGKRVPLPAEVATNIAAHVTHDALSPREIEILVLVAAGSSNKRIGDQLGISEQTVKAHMKNAMSKLGARDRTHAVTLSLQRGILSLGDDSVDRG
ncbi:response regulator transcription factor [Stenotrophomonas sp.]|uniref:response regulator transcription factor n=1 Tax=Stenotrophomonas sp. TaxID=69392 RepID=UPI0028AB35D4|nr:response regulator transcription factor [Stenotrophomonas sp.]